MPERHLEEEIRRTMLEVGRSCRALVGRCKAVQSLLQDADRMGPLSRYAATVESHLQAALSSISLMSNGGRLSLDRIQSGGAGPSDRVVLRCVSNALGRLGSDAPAGAKSSTERPSLQGHSRLVGIPQILDFLGSLGRTGTLEVTSLAETFRVVLEDGQVVHAESDQAPQGQRLGDVLVAQEALTVSGLATFLKTSDTDLRLGAALVAAGKVSREQLQRALETQIRQLFLRLFGAHSATYAFHDVPPDELTHHVRMNTPVLLLESAAHAEIKPAPVPEPAPAAEPPADAA